MAYTGVIDRYRSLLNISEGINPVTLYEGDTPLIPLPRLAAELGGGFELFRQI